MGLDSDDLGGTRDYAYYVTMDEVLLLAGEFVETARHAETDMELEIYLKMASRSMRCALQMCLDRLKEKSDEHLSRNAGDGLH
jgi:hypothetical protein